MHRYAAERLREITELAADLALHDTSTRLTHLLLRRFGAERLLLEAEGCQITAASSVKEALLKLGEQSSIDLLICDFHLGGGDTCLELVAAFRQRVSASLPVILLTGDTSTTIRALAQDERWRLASKPLQADQLLTLMDELLRG